jgi:hypothetical protein
MHDAVEQTRGGAKTNRLSARRTCLCSNEQKTIRALHDSSLYDRWLNQMRSWWPLKSSRDCSIGRGFIVRTRARAPGARAPMEKPGDASAGAATPPLAPPSSRPTLAHRERSCARTAALPACRPARPGDRNWEAAVPGVVRARSCFPSAKLIPVCVRFWGRLFCMHDACARVPLLLLLVPRNGGACVCRYSHPVPFQIVVIV